MRKVVLWGLAAALLAGVALTVLPGDSRAQLFNSSKKSENSEPAANTAKGGGGGNSAPLFNSGSSTKGASPIFTDPTLKQNNAGGKARPYGSATPTAQRTPPKSNNGFSRPGATQETAQDRAIREAAMRRVQDSNSKVAEVQAHLARMEADRQAGRTSQPTTSEREDRQFGTMVPEPAPENTGPMVYDKHKNTKNAAPSKLFNSAQ